MNTNPVWSNIFRRSSDATSKVTELWMKTPLFDGIPPSQCRRLMENMYPRYYKCGEPIFSEGESGAGAVLVSSGKVQIKSSGKVLAELSEGDFFGEVALVLDEPRTADAVASEDSELYFLIKQDVNEWVNRSPRHGAQLMRNVAFLLASRLKQANHHLSESTADSDRTLSDG